MMAPAQDRIVKLRIECGGATDPMLAKLRAGVLMQSAPLHPRSLPPASILCVRRMRDPLPGRVALHGLSVAPPMEWQRSVQSALERMAERAARPARGDHARDAESVLFADWAEALACFIREWLEGRAGESWWWSGLFGEARPSFETALVRLTEEPVYLPAVIQRLAPVGRVQQFLAALEPSRVAKLLQNLERSYAAHAVFAAVLRALEVETQVEASVRLDPLIAERAVVIKRQAGMGRPPWHAYVAESASEAALPKLTRVLRIGAVMLARMPSVFLSERFVVRVREWSMQMQAVALALSVPAGGDCEAASTEFPPIVKNDSAAPASHQAAGEAAIAASSGLPEVEEEFPPLPDDEIGGAAEYDTLELACAPSREPASVSDVVAADSTEASLLSMAETPQCVVTAYAGIFYLINLALHWKLYSDFTRPQSRGLSMPLWDFLTLAGLRLLDDADARDPIFDLFAELAGRDPEQDRESWASRQDHAWFDWFAIRASRRLRRALDLREEDSLSKVLLEHRGRIHVTDSRIDVVFDLEQHPISIRVAGLDRDPGWIPAAGRSFRFHYEVS